MIILRLLLVAFNVAVVTFLIYELIRIYQSPEQGSRKALIIAAGILLLLTPLAMFLRFIPPAPVYFLIYPAAISFFIYLTRNSGPAKD